METVERLEAVEQIRQLVARYAVAIDARDLAALADLYAPDVREQSMAAIRAELPEGRTFHLTADPVVTFNGPGAASGVVLCRGECEKGEEWIVCGVRYEDRYIQRKGRWYFAGRTRHLLYAADVLARP